MTQSTTKKLLDSVEWGPVGTYTTRKGRSKICRKGIPTPLFWSRWKIYQQEYKALSITVSWTDTVKVYSRKTGVSRNKKLWEVTAWNCGIFQ